MKENNNQDLHFIFYERLCDDPVSLRLQSIFLLFLNNEISMFNIYKLGDGVAISKSENVTHSLTDSPTQTLKA